MITLIHGQAELLRSEALAQIRERIADDPGLAELNTTHVEGRQSSPQAALAEMQFACDSLPFLAERRLVVAEGLLGRLGGGSAASAAAGASGAGSGPSQGAAGGETIPAGAGRAGSRPAAGDTTADRRRALLAYLDQVPASAELVFMEDEIVTGGPLLRRLLELQGAGQARIIACPPPRGAELISWIRARAQKRGVALDAAAVSDLAEFVGDDLRQLDQEILKLRDYAGGQRPVTRADVRRLVPATRAANVFDLVEALGLGEAERAGRLLCHALDVDGEEPLRLMALISRQYRLLIQAKALQADGARPPDIARELHVPEWSVGKLVSQAGRHSGARLIRALEQILAVDESIKTGKLSDREAMDVLLAELAGSPGH